jgi:hypothetical protein
MKAEPGVPWVRPELPAAGELASPAGLCWEAPGNHAEKPRFHRADVTKKQEPRGTKCALLPCVLSVPTWAE